WYQRASIMLMGSRLEGFPMVLLEAKSYGLPVVAFDCPTGPKEIVRHEIDGFLAKQPDEFAAAVQLLIEDPDLRERMGKSAVEDVRSRFSVEQARDRWSDLIATIHAEP
ncbi:MAG TPA: glycosyltransferase, partial [Pyrinomonadaceae bacterium]|nr:glycosyltransferase [Pyrinomonadaceae bacterium]